MPEGSRKSLRWSDVTPRATWINRRALLAGAVAGLALPGAARADVGRYSTDAAPNTLEEITNYNNYYEFGWNKDDPAAYSGALNGNAFDMTVTPGQCSDGMSDRTYPFTVTLKIADETRGGCAWTDRMRFTGSENP